MLQEDFENLESMSLVNEIVSLGKSMGLKVSDNDIEELFEYQKTEPTSGKKHLHEMYVQEGRQISSKEKEYKETISTKAIKELFFHWFKTIYCWMMTLW